MKDFLYFFRLSRPLNVLITLVAYCLGAFLANEKEISFFREIEFWYGMIALTVISATGYWVNDAFDFKIDRVNKPKRVIVNAHLSVKKVLTGYFVAVILVLGGSFLLQNISLFFINLSAVVLLFGYAAWLKRTTVVGNLVIAALTGLVIYYAGMIYGFTPALIWTVIFAFEVTFLREVVKDIEDIEGDLKFRLNTLPIRAGISITKQVLYISVIIFILSCYGPLVMGAMVGAEIQWIYLGLSITLVQVPALLILWQLYRASNNGQFRLISTYLKALIILGMLSLLFL